MQTIIRATRHERLCKAIRTHGWRRRDRIEIVAGILKECLVGQTYTELVYLMRIGAAQITDYLNWMHSSGLLEKEIRNMCPHGLARACQDHSSPQEVLPSQNENPSLYILLANARARRESHYKPHARTI